MRIHHLNCGCMCPLGGRLMDGVSSGLTAHLVCHCLLIETDHGLVLVDTGFGMRDVQQPYERLSPFFIHFNRIQFERRDTALEQVRARGFSPRDVRHIVLTHLDFDHAGGLEDFPDAKVHVLQSEAETAETSGGLISGRRYRPEQWDEVRHWCLYEPGGERWFGFDAVRDLDGLPPEILMVPLRGHTIGHAGVAIKTPEGWLLHAGDAYFYRHEMDPKPSCTPGLAAYQRMMGQDHQARRRNQARLRALANSQDDMRIFCSHDPVELEALSRLSSGWRPV
ncbi:MBL fold metallo-hydrolase [Microvirga rosea]|uniref:MBL fold metallo-hydrolase n=1 Tax=Microvirga rosea TaxID=2715425 RepID=UPI001D0A223C|nr:MBL fold metallo-hydrolase [Microvirga rosea]MCB8823128.1 MBL fold metallo-hydrolase [Microvirga rosea]